MKKINILFIFIFSVPSATFAQQSDLLEKYRSMAVEYRRTRQTLWSAVQMLTQKLCCQTIHDCPKVVPLHYESE